MILHCCIISTKRWCPSSLTLKIEIQVKFSSLLSNTELAKRCRFTRHVKKSYERLHFPRKHLSVFAVEDSKS